MFTTPLQAAKYLKQHGLEELLDTEFSAFAILLSQLPDPTEYHIMELGANNISAKQTLLLNAAYRRNHDDGLLFVKALETPEAALVSYTGFSRESLEVYGAVWQNLLQKIYAPVYNFVIGNELSQCMVTTRNEYLGTINLAQDLGKKPLHFSYNVLSSTLPKKRYIELPFALSELAGDHVHIFKESNLRDYIDAAASQRINPVSGENIPLEKQAIKLPNKFHQKKSYYAKGAKHFFEIPLPEVNLYSPFQKLHEKDSLVADQENYVVLKFSIPNTNSSQ